MAFRRRAATLPPPRTQRDGLSGWLPSLLTMRRSARRRRSAEKSSMACFWAVRTRTMLGMTVRYVPTCRCHPEWDE